MHLLKFLHLISVAIVLSAEDPEVAGIIATSRPLRLDVIDLQKVRGFALSLGDGVKELTKLIAIQNHLRRGGGFMGLL